MRILNLNNKKSSKPDYMLTTRNYNVTYSIPSSIINTAEKRLEKLKPKIKSIILDEKEFDKFIKNIRDELIKKPSKSEKSILKSASKFISSEEQ